MSKNLKGYREVEFPEDTGSGKKRGKNEEVRRERSSKEQRNQDRKDAKKQIVKDVVILALFLIAAFTAVILINRYHPKKQESEPAGDPGASSLSESPEETEADSSSENSETVSVSDPEPETEPQTAPPTEAPTETATVPPESVAPTVAPTVAPSTASTGEEPKMYPYRALQPGLAIPVQGGITMPSWITQDLLRPGADSRPGTQIGTIKHVVVHYVGNVGSSAKDNRDYFEGNVDGRRVSSHFIVGMYGEIIQCIPLNEVAYAQGISQKYVDQGMVNHNYDSISIENCHPYSNGQFTSETYWALVKLTAWLLEQYGLGPDSLLRHYDATTNTQVGVHGKGCPLYFVEHPEAWEQFKATVGRFMEENPNLQ